jgi:branched-chain amino acid transport system ATP-binding protein
MTREAIIIERGVIAHRAPSTELLAEQAVLDRYVGLNLEGN